MKRYESLDILRGLTVALMILVNNGAGSVRFATLSHASWEGVTLCDLVFPTFIFCAGVAMAFSLAHFDCFNKDVSKKIFRRGLIIFLLGLVLNAFPFYPLHQDPSMTFGENYISWLSHIRIMGVLQRIAICYVIGSILVLTLKKTSRIIGVIIGLSVVYTGILVLFGPVVGAFSYECNVANDINTFLLGKDHVYKVLTRPDGSLIGFDPEGIVDTLSAICTILIGFLSGRIIRETSTKEEAALKIFAWSAVCTASGLFLSTWVPMIKKIWTTSYMLYAAGSSMAMLSLLIYVVDIKKKSQWFYPFKAMGMNPLVLYCMSWILAVTLTGIIGFDKNAVFGGNEWTSLLYSLLFVSVHLVTGILLYKKRIFIKI